MCAVEPHLVDGAVFRQEFKKLVEIIFVVVVDEETEFTLVLKRPARHFARNGAPGVAAQVAVESLRMFNLVEVGRREVNSHLQSVFAARGRKVLQHVALSVAEAGRHDAVAGVAALPEHEAVVVLGGNDHHGHAGGLEGLAPLVGVELAEGEDGGVLHARAPFLAGEGVGPEVYEGDELTVERGPLVGGGHHVDSLLQNDFRAVGGQHLLCAQAFEFNFLCTAGQGQQQAAEKVAGYRFHSCCESWGKSEFFRGHCFSHAKIVKGERKGKTKTEFSVRTLPSRLLFSVKIVKGGRKGKMKTKFSVQTFPGRLLFPVKNKRESRAVLGKVKHFS